MIQNNIDKLKEEWGMVHPKVELDDLANIWVLEYEGRPPSTSYVSEIKCRTLLIEKGLWEHESELNG